MKKTLTIFVLLIATLMASVHQSNAQGRVVINEYLPWPSNTCGATAEFVELMNFGPGPINIGCYILTDGDYSVTIPANTILYPGEFYVIAGMDIIPAPCANIDSTIHADLNWNTCGCTNAPIPTTGDGFFTDGGSGNEQIVLLDPNLKVVDAVVRTLPGEPSSIITSTATGCTSHTFNIDTMAINYETLGMSTGRGNSFARILDGDCGWVKDPQQSGNATNNTPTDASAVTYSFFYVEAQDCSSNHGAVSINVRRQSLSDFFPMNYTLAYDVNGDGVFGFNDQYSYGIDSTPPDIYISGLPPGRYRITVESVLGCSLKSFDFSILPCIPVLSAQLSFFRYAGLKNGNHKIEWRFENASAFSSVWLEKSRDNRAWTTAANFDNTAGDYFNWLEPSNSGYRFFRLRIAWPDGTTFFSPVIDLTTNPSFQLLKCSSNPVSDVLWLEAAMPMQGVDYNIFDAAGVRIANGKFYAANADHRFSISTSALPMGSYFLTTGGAQPISLRFVKH